MSLSQIVSRQLPTMRQSLRTFSMAARQMAGGDAGAPRSGGSQQGDAWTKREHAQEEYAVRQREMEKLKALKEKIAANEGQLAKDRKEMEELSKKHDRK
ncbi:putative mitochondrial ATPase inhibitor [Piedraia hortae CBS 480.64]|uniref:ATPase inhibitor, mitochondrial n=1 Tax=Piedraia hortae CBS 480.64 TaxID=1314780 RepID=A0A6A7BX07_9PEZI|nr:putative mitochondrial ATPase inhibitor [Piedraia hortae CBS 480.64]